MSREPLTRMEILFGVLQQSLMYNWIEVVLIGIFLAMHIQGVVWFPFLWVVFCMVGMWVVITSVQAAQEEARLMVLDRELFISDFLTAAIFTTVLAWLSWDYGWQFPAMFLVAVGQNLRYTALSMSWLMKEREAKNERK